MGYVRDAAALAKPAASISIAMNLRSPTLTWAAKVLDATTTLPDAMFPRCMVGGAQSLASPLVLQNEFFRDLVQAPSRRKLLPALVRGGLTRHYRSNFCSCMIVGQYRRIKADR